MTPASTLPTVRETSILARRLGSRLVARREVAELVKDWSWSAMAGDGASRFRWASQSRFGKLLRWQLVPIALLVKPGPRAGQL